MENSCQVLGQDIISSHTLPELKGNIHALIDLRLDSMDVVTGHDD